jgi:hypothetical protein
MKKISWTENLPLSLTARTEIFPAAGVNELRSVYMAGISDADMFPIAKWVNETGIGRRTSFDTFKFRNRADMAMFLLHWT